MNNFAISHKNSIVPGKAPLPADLERGELAVNLADRKLFTKDQNNAVVELGTGQPLIASTAPPVEAGRLWFDPATGQLHVGYKDGTGERWVICGGPPGKDGERLPAGMLGWWSGPAAPAGWLKADGAAISRSTYADLFNAIGTHYGPGDGGSTFNLPDLRGAFMRGLDEGRGIDANRVRGGLQWSDNIHHTHEIHDPSHAHGVWDPGHGHHLHDPGHSHGVHDPGHEHGYHRADVAAGGPSPTTGQNEQYHVRGMHHAWVGTDWRGTGIGIHGAGTGAWIESNGTGIGIHGSGTGIGIHGSGGGESRPTNVAILAVIKF